VTDRYLKAITNRRSRVDPGWSAHVAVPHRNEQSVASIGASRLPGFQRALRHGRGRVACVLRECNGGGVPTRLVHLVIDAADPSRLARFWSAALGWEVAAEEPAEVDVWPTGYHYPDPVALPLVFVPVSEPNTGKNRVHLDLATESAGHQAAEVDRLRSLGAVPADIGQIDVPWVVLADPEGNEFCVLDPRAAYRDTGPVAAVVIDCVDPVALAGFWEMAAGWVPSGTAEGWVSLRSSHGVGPYLELLRVPDAKAVKNRIHLDVAPPAGGDHLAAVKLLQEAGAVPADVGQGDVPWTVLADPQGNEFCVLTPR
jgi:predicted enzyme related to lactoylglutathione lyase